MDILGESKKGFSSTEDPRGGLGTKSSGSRDNHGSDETINPNNKEMQPTAVSQAGGKGGEELIAQPTHLELAGTTIACPSYQYSDQCYGAAVPAYGSQTLVHPQCLGVNVARMALPLEMAEEPVYVNAKQYHGILRRRQTRAKLELERKLIKARKPYLHESRHLHAMRRARGCGGRFLNTKKHDSNTCSNTPSEGRGSGATFSSHRPTNGSNQNNISADSSTGFREAPDQSHQAFTKSNGGHGSYFHQGFQRDHLDRALTIK